MINAPTPVNFDDFPETLGSPSALYGLPQDVSFCNRCVISNQRPNSAVEFKHVKDSKKATIRFDDTGVCDACLVTETKTAEVDWEERDRELRALLDRYRSRNGGYDCLVPGSGGKDSFYAAWMLKYEYGMNPLTVTWAPHIYTTWGWENFQRWIHAGFDNNLFTPNGRAHRLLTRLATEVLFHPFQPFILGQKNLAPKMSVLYNLPLVFYGENESEYGNPKEDQNAAQRSWDYFTETDPSEIALGGVSIKDLKSDFGLSDTDIECYLPPNPDGLRKTGTEVHYLGYYLKWHPQGAYYHAQEHGGFEPAPERTAGTYSKYNGIDDRVDDFHFYTTYIKFGIGRATYDAAQETRSGDIGRDEAVALVRRYDGEFPERFAEEIFTYLSIPEKEFPIASKQFEQPILDRDYFMKLQDNFRSPHLWKHTDRGWELRATVFDKR
jgi:N-acetyl sugar amidotransferase